MKKILLTLTLLTIVLGIIGFSLNTLFGMNTVTYLETINVNGVVMQRYNFWNYIENIRNTFGTVSELKLDLPDVTWQETNDFLADISHNLAVMINALILGLNVLIYPIRVVFYAIKIVLSMIGLPMADTTDSANNPLKWLIDLAKWLTQMQIPFIDA